MRWKGMMLLVFLFFLVLPLVNADTTYTYNSETKVNDDGTTTTKIYSGTRFGFEDGEWKPIERLSTFKGTTPITCNVDSDKKFGVQCLDYNMTHKKLKLRFLTLFLLNRNANLRFIDRETLMEKMEKRQTFKFKNFLQYSELWVESGLNEEVHFGDNSTIVTLQDANSDNMDDGWGSNEYDDRERGADDEFSVGSPGDNFEGVAIMRWNISSFVSQADEVLSANLTLYFKGEDFGGGSDYFNVSTHYVYTTFQVDSLEWTEGNAAAWAVAANGEFTWEDRPNSTFYNTTKTDTEKFQDNQALGFVDWDVTPIIETARGNSQTNVSIYLVSHNGSGAGDDYADFWSKEYSSNTSQRPYLTINYVNYSVSMSTVRLDPTTSYYNTTILGYCNATTDSDTVSYYYEWFVNETSYDSGLTSTFTSNTEQNVANLTNITKDFNVTLQCRGYTNQNSTWMNSSALQISNLAPWATSVSADNSSGGLNCSYTFNDNDPSDTDTSQFFRWYINDALNSSYTNQELGEGNYSVGDNISCSVIVNDGDDNASSWSNSSVVTVGDTTAPVLFDARLSASSGTTDTAYTISVNCSEENSLAANFPMVQFTDPNSVVQGNFTMTLDTGDSYIKSYTFSVAGTYNNFKFFCRDGSSNEAQNTSNSLTFVASAPASGGSGSSGGGGSRDYGDEGACGFSIVLPRTKKIDFQGKAGHISPDGEIKIYNNCTTTKTFFFSFKESRLENICTLAVKEVEVPGKTPFKNIIRCNILGEDVSGSVLIRNSDAKDGSVQITVRETFMGVFVTGIINTATGKSPLGIVIVFSLLTLTIVGFIVHSKITSSS